MSHHKLAARLITLTVATLSAAPVLAEPVDRYFSGEPTQCGRREFASEWRLAGDTTSQLVFEVWQRRSDRNGANYRGQSWDVTGADLSQPLELKGNGDLWRVTGLGGDAPRMVEINRSGEAQDDCVLELQPAALPMERYEDVIALLETEQPGLAEAIRVAPEITALPPANLLPELKRVAMQNAVRDKEQAFWERYEKASLARADDIADTTLFDDLGAMATDEGAREQRRFHTELLTNALQRRVASVDAQGGDLLASAVADDRFCARLDGLSRIYDWSSYLLTTTGVPVKTWDEDLAQKYLDLSSACGKEGENFAQTVTKRWPDIQARQQGYAELDAEAARISQLPPNLDSLAAANWLQVDRDMLRDLRSDAGIDQDEALAILNPALEAKREEVVPLAAAELAEGVADAPLSEIPDYCETRQRAVFDGYYQVPQVLEAARVQCENLAAKAYQEAGLRDIAAAEEALLALPETPEALAESNFYSLPDLPSGRFLDGPFAEAHERLEAAYSNADAQLAPKRKKAMDAAVSAVEQVFEEAGPMDEEGRAAQYCSPIQRNYDSRFESLRAVCSQKMAAVRANRKKARCDAIWADIDAPKGFREGRISLPFGGRAMAVEELVCSPEFSQLGLNIEDNSGFFSSEYVLTREAVFGGTPVRFTAVLNKPDSASGEWMVSEPTLNGDAISGPDIKTSVDIMGCAISLEACFRNH